MLIFSSKGWVDANKASQSTIEELQGRYFIYSKLLLLLFTLSRNIRLHIYLNYSGTYLVVLAQFSIFMMQFCISISTFYQASDEKISSKIVKKVMKNENLSYYLRLISYRFKIGFTDYNLTLHCIMCQKWFLVTHGAYLIILLLPTNNFHIFKTILARCGWYFIFCPISSILCDANSRICYYYVIHLFGRHVFKIMN